MYNHVFRFMHSTYIDCGQTFAITFLKIPQMWIYDEHNITQMTSGTMSPFA